MVRVAVIGAAGQMGAATCRAVEAAEDLELVAAISPSHEGRSLAELAGTATTSLVVAGSLDELEPSGAEVAVDFTNARAARANLERCLADHVHVVCGTTGMSPGDLAALEECCTAPDAPNVVLAANFSISAVLLWRLAELAAPFFDGIEIVELHHEHKRDAPSGTALETARRLAAARREHSSGPLTPDPTTDEVLAGARGGLGPDSIRIHSVRLPGLVAHEEVLLGAPGQALTIRQDSFDRVSFMPGVLLAIRSVASTPGLTVGLERLLAL